MSYLYHWRKENYQSDPSMAEDPPFENGIGLNSRNKLFKDIDDGDVIYAFSRRDDGVYVLVAKGPVCCSYEDDGEFTAEIDFEDLIFYDPELGEDIEPVIRQMPLSLKNPSLGRNFQGFAHVKKVSNVSEESIESFANRQAKL